MHLTFHGCLRAMAVGALCCAGAPALAQGQDSTPGERNLLVMAELLPGHYDNVNQNYFDQRRKLPDADRHARISTTITRVAAPAFDPYAFRRRADQFRGAQKPKACRFEWQGQDVYTDNTIELSASSLWFADHKFVAGTDRRITGVESGEPFWLERARTFHCYVDMPGVGGGRDIPFKRWDDIVLDDKGGEYWFTSSETPPREMGIRLTAVTWHVLNEKNGNFNRDSLVLYVSERLPDGASREHGYAFTDPDPDATRLGINLQWLLANCAMTRRDQARPEM